MAPIGRLLVDKRRHGTQGGDMRQTLAGVCENDIREAAQHPKNIKKSSREPPFSATQKNIQKYTKKLPKWLKKNKCQYGPRCGQIGPR